MKSETCYLLGALRDGNFDVRLGKNYELRIYQDNKRWLVSVSELFHRNFRIKPKITGNLLRINNKKIIEELLLISEYRNPQKFWGTPSYLRKCSTEETWWYVSGFWDSEGGLPLNPETATRKYISFDQKNRDSLEFIRNFLIEEGFRPTNLTYTGGVWQFRLTRKADVKRFAGKLHSFHQGKYCRLIRLIASVP